MMNMNDLGWVSMKVARFEILRTNGRTQVFVDRPWHAEPYISKVLGGVKISEEMQTKRPNLEKRVNEQNKIKHRFINHSMDGSIRNLACWKPKTSTTWQETVKLFVVVNWRR